MHQTAKPRQFSIINFQLNSTFQPENTPVTHWFVKHLEMAQHQRSEFKPYIAADDRSVKEFTLQAVLLGSLFGILFGAATVYLALKAGLTVSASIPIAVLAISLGRRFLGTTILENNIIQNPVTFYKWVHMWLINLSVLGLQRLTLPLSSLSLYLI